MQFNSISNRLKFYSRTNIDNPTKTTKTPEHKQQQNTTTESKLLKPAVVSASVLGTVSAMSAISALRGKVKFPTKFTGNIKDFQLSEVEKFNPFKKSGWKQLATKMKYGPLDIFTIAGASTAGGLTAGVALDDKKHKKAKFKEASTQMVGNIIFPLICVSTVQALTNKFIAPKVAENTLKKVKVASGIGTFLVGILGGHKIANKVNSKIFAQESKRELKASDAFVHIDDGCSIISIVGKGNKTCEAAARIIPAVLATTGVITGIAKDDGKKDHTKQTVDNTLT